MREPQLRMHRARSCIPCAPSPAQPWSRVVAAVVVRLKRTSTCYIYTRRGAMQGRAGRPRQGLHTDACQHWPDHTAVARPQHTCAWVVVDHSWLRGQGARWHIPAQKALREAWPLVFKRPHQMAILCMGCDVQADVQAQARSHRVVVCRYGGTRITRFARLESHRGNVGPP